MAHSDLAEVWARSLDGLADLQIQPHQRAWLKLTRPLGLVENTALIATPNEFVKEQLETRLRALVTHALSRELGRSIQLAVTVDPAATGTSAPPPNGPGGPGAPTAPPDATPAPPAGAAPARIAPSGRVSAGYGARDSAWGSAWTGKPPDPGRHARHPHARHRHGQRGHRQLDPSSRQ